MLFGNISNYVEPFAGSLAVLLYSPKISKIETINDNDCLLINFWRAVTFDVENVIKFADHPVHEAELHARHRWILTQVTDEFIKNMHSDPHFFNSQLAGYWVWGMGASVGDNWLKPKGLNAAPLLSSGGGGIHGMKANIDVWMHQLQNRLRKVRMICGDWKRLTSPAILWNNIGLGKDDITGIFLDPPYSFLGRDKVYREEHDVFGDVCKWAIESSKPDVRIAVCGYDGDYEFPDNWKKYNWQANGGFANLGNSRGKANSKREVIWFNEYCL